MRYSDLELWQLVATHGKWHAAYLAVEISKLWYSKQTTLELADIEIRSHIRFFSKAPQGNERGAMGSKNPPAY